MAVNDAIDVWIPLEYFAVDIAFDVASPGVWVYSATVGDVVLDQIGVRGDERGCHISREQVGVWIVRMAHRDVAECVDDILVMEDVVRCDEGAIYLREAVSLAAGLAEFQPSHLCQIDHGRNISSARATQRPQPDMATALTTLKVLLQDADAVYPSSPLPLQHFVMEIDGELPNLAIVPSVGGLSLVGAGMSAKMG